MHPLFSISLCLFLASVPLCAAEKQPLRNKFESGKEYTLQTESELVLTAAGQPESTGQKQKISQTIDLKASLEPGTNNTRLAVVFSGLKARIEIEGKAFDYDSENPAIAPPFVQQMFGAFLQKSFTLVYDKDGAFVDVKDLVDLDATPLGQGQSLTGKQLAETFRKTLELGLPLQPVAVGDKWTITDQLEVPPMGALSIEGSGTLDSLGSSSQPLAKITIQGSIKSPASSPQQLVESASTSTYKGQVTFDLKKNLFTENLLISSCQFKINGQDIQVTQKSTSALAPKKS